MNVQRASFNPDCCLCPRLASHLRQVHRRYPDYHARPVAPFGDPKAPLLIAGLAPGRHGANATGRPFTGDYAGKLLFRTLHRFGFASRPHSIDRRDGLQLVHCRITNAVKCLPPGNKPTTAEIRTCNRYLRSELAVLGKGSVILALGRIAHQAVLMALDYPISSHPFRHGQVHTLANGLRLVDCYHCSRYNTQTGRLTPEMFTNVFKKIVELIDISI